MKSSEDSAPKPMMPIGYRPVLIMRYYAHFGHTDFTLLGLRFACSQDYFLNYQETHPTTCPDQGR
jgi:NDP-sugar pyrophosphorylase family protein